MQKTRSQKQQLPLQERGRQKFFSRMLDCISLPFKGIALKITEKIVVGFMVQMARENRDYDVYNLRYLGLERK